MDKVRIDRLRRVARRRGLTLRKIRRRDPKALDAGTFMLMDGNQVLIGASMKDFGHNFRPDLTADLDEIEAYLARDTR